MMIGTIIFLAIVVIFIIIPIMIKKKEIFWIYFIIIIGLLSIYWSILYIEVYFTSTYHGFLIIPIPLILFILSLPPLFGIVIKLRLDFIKNPYKDTLLYFIWQKFKYRLVSKTLKLTIVILLLFQLFLLNSAHTAYTIAKKLKYIDNNTSMWSFYSPYVKEVQLNGKRYSYRRGIYVDNPERY